MGLASSQHVGSSQTWDWTMSPALAGGFPTTGAQRKPCPPFTDYTSLSSQGRFKQLLIREGRRQVRNKVRGRFRRVGTSGYLWLICVDMWQKPTWYHKAISFIKINLKKKETVVPHWGKVFVLPQEIHMTIPLSCSVGTNGNPLQCSCLENPKDGGA